MAATLSATMGLMVTPWQIPCGIFISEPSTHLLQVCGPTFLPPSELPLIHAALRGQRGSRPGEPAPLVWREKQRVTHLRVLPSCWGLGFRQVKPAALSVPLVWAALALLAPSDAFSLP